MRGRTQDAGIRGQIFSSRRYRALRKNTLVVSHQRLKTNGHSGLRHGFTLSTTTYEYSFARFESVCGLWQEDHSKINDGKVKERPVSSPINVVKLIPKQPPVGATGVNLTGTIMAA